MQPVPWTLAHAAVCVGVVQSQIPHATFQIPQIPLQIPHATVLSGSADSASDSACHVLCQVPQIPQIPLRFRVPRFCQVPQIPQIPLQIPRVTVLPDSASDSALLKHHLCNPAGCNSVCPPPVGRKDLPVR